MNNLTRVRTVLFLVLTVALLIAATAMINESMMRSLVNAARPVVEVSPAQAARLLNPIVFIAISLAWLIVIRVSLIVWMGTAYAFAREQLHIRDFHHRQWTFWGWAVPFVNLYKPCQVLRELYRCGDPSAGEQPLTEVPSSTALVLWWSVHRFLHLLYVLSIVVLALNAVTGIFLSPLPDPITQVKWTAGIYALLAIGWFFVVGFLTGRLRRRALLEEGKEEVEEDEDEEEYGYGDEEDESDQANTHFNTAFRREPLIGDLQEAPAPKGAVFLPLPPEPTLEPMMEREPERHTEPELETKLEPEPDPDPEPEPEPERPYHPVKAPSKADTGILRKNVILVEQEPDEPEFDEASAYGKIAEELESGKRDKGTWLRAVVESAGDEGRQETLYATLRLKQLRMAYQKELATAAERRRAEAKERAESERKAERRREAEKYLMEGFHHQDAVTLDGPKFLEVVRVAAEENRVNQRSRSNGKTLLHMAVERIAFHSRQADKDESNAELLAYDRQAIRILLDAGADPALRDRGSRSAHDYARAVGVPLRQMG